MAASHWPWIGFLSLDFRSPSELPSFQVLLASYCSSYPQHLPTLYTNLTGGRCLTYIGTEGAYQSNRLYRDSLSRAAVTRFIEDPKTANIILPRGAVAELQDFLRRYVESSSIGSRTIPAFEGEFAKRNDPMSFKNITFSEIYLNLGLIDGELLDYSSARPIKRILDALSRKAQAVPGEIVRLDSDSNFRDKVFESLSKWRGQRTIANAVDAQNIADTVSLFRRTALREAQSPPLLISTSPTVHRIAKQISDFSSTEFGAYPVLGNSLDLILTHTIVQRESPDYSVRTLLRIRDTLKPTLTAIQELLSKGERELEKQISQRNSDIESIQRQIERFRELWCSINSETLLKASGFELALCAQLVQLGEATSEGKLVISVSFVWQEILRELERNPHFLYEFSKYPRKFEELVAGAYKKYGWDIVELTPHSADRGRDVIATKLGFGSVRFLDQVKAYSPGTLVTHEEVRAMVGVLSLDQSASKGLITTTSDFAPGVFKSTEFRGMMPHRLELKNGDQLRTWLLDAWLNEGMGR